jgi:hypothetical protein
MRMTRGWTGLRTAVFALAIGLTAASGASASPTLINYSTSGGVDSTGVSGPNVISFNSVSNGAFVTPSAFSLGEFLVAALPAGVSTTYTNTPFHVTFGINQVNSTNTSITPMTITGELNGTITGPSQSSVVATFDAVSSPNFTIGGANDVLSILGTTVSLVPSTTNSGRTTAQAQLLSNSAPVPEPATLAVFATAIAGITLRRRLRARG